MSIKVAQFLDVADGLQPKQFSVGSRISLTSLADLDPIYRQLLDGPYACVMAVMGGDGRPNLTPMWFDYDGSTVLVNVAAQRKKVDWIRANGEISIAIVNPANMYHWVSIKCTVARRCRRGGSGYGSARQDLDQVHGQRATVRIA
jgi:Pyridoxamine 5'-phosphate oxidase